MGIKAKSNRTVKTVEGTQNKSMWILNFKGPEKKVTAGTKNVKLLNQKILF